MEGNTMALGKRNNGNFRLSSVEVGAPRIWIHLNRIRKKHLEEKTGTSGKNRPPHPPPTPASLLGGYPPALVRRIGIRRL